MANARTTVCMSEVLLSRVIQHTKENGEKLSDFYNRAVLNQLENDGDFEVRDLFEKESGSNDGENP